MDMKYNEVTLNILNKLDEIVSKYSGKVYLTKDKRLNSKYFKKKILSLFSRNYKR